MRTGLFITAVALLLLIIAGCDGFFTPRTDNGGSVGPAASFAYVSNFNGGGAGSVSAFSVNQTTGVLTSLGAEFLTGGGIGSGPAAITVAGNFVYTANEGGGVSGFVINNNGTLSEISGSPFEADVVPTSLVADPTGQFLFVANAGSLDIVTYSINATTGALSLEASSPTTLVGAPFGLAMHPNGRFLYAAMDVNGIAALSFDATTGALTLVRNVPQLLGGRPRSVVVSPSGGILYVADFVNGVEVFNINSTTGDLIAQNTTAVPAENVPVAIATDPAGKFVYVTNRDSNNVSGYAVLNDGTLTELSGSPFTTGTTPVSVQVDPTGSFVYVTNFTGSPGISIFTISTAAPGVLNSAGSADAGSQPTGIALK